MRTLDGPTSRPATAPEATQYLTFSLGDNPQPSDELQMRAFWRRWRELVAQ